MNELALFAGAGGGILGAELLGWRTVCAVEIEPFPIAVLVQRQNDGVLKPFPIWDDITTFDGRPWRGAVDVVTGGFPCQDISAAGKGAGITGERSGLWREMARVIREVRPRFALMENSPILTSRGLDVVLGDVAELGYNARWCVLGADDAGMVHHRKRIWILAYMHQDEHPVAGPRGQWRLPQQPGRMDLRAREGRRQKHRRQLESRNDRIVDGVANQMDRLAAIGNGQSAPVVRLAWDVLSEGLI